LSYSAITASVAPTVNQRPIEFCDLFKIGIGPSSSHTMGPMIAAKQFVQRLPLQQAEIARIEVTTFGSLAWTGKGHATDKALALGLAGNQPDTVDPDQADRDWLSIQAEQCVILPSGRRLRFSSKRDIIFDRSTMIDGHPNAMTFRAFSSEGELLQSETYFSIGGGFVRRLGDDLASAPLGRPQVPFPYSSADELLRICVEGQFDIADIVLANNAAVSSNAAVLGAIDRVIDVMMACIERGLASEGELPGGLRVQRRAAQLYRSLRSSETSNFRISNDTIEYVTAFAMAVNEENAAGGRVVTAPTNGGAGVLPAVLRYYRDFCPGSDRRGLQVFLMTATAFGDLIKRRASISGAEVGCQGEVGSAASMAAGGLAAALGGSPRQVENAAEIAMEHHLGMTCDPIGGLVQIPCIERNAFGAVKAISAANLALRGDGSHRVSFDQVIEAMRQTGLDMKEIYRETSRGGLAANVPEC
jgi:L-serine dehydratase